jgi:hypothetical protein
MELDLPPERVDIQPQVLGSVGFHVATSRVEEPICACEISSVKMIDRYRRLNQRLIESSFGRGAIAPQVFPHFMSLEVIAAVEEVDAGPIARIRECEHDDAGG